AFGIPLAGCPKFFADRDLDVAVDGRRKRIFHHVSSHARQTRGGTTRVRAHYRGARAFQWHHYSGKIVLPDNLRIMHFAAPAILLEDITLREQREQKYLGLKRVARLLTQRLEE